MIAISIQLSQPLEGDSIFKDFLEEHGEGLYGLTFHVKDKKELVDLMTIALLHGTQGLEQGRLIANTLLSQTCFTYHWSEYCEIGLSDNRVTNQAV